MPKVFDCFTFFNELDLLEIRFSELNDVVDYFVIVESEETFTGKKKRFTFEDNKSRFSKYLSKIIHLKKPKMDDSLSSWDREHAQRDELINGLQKATPDDIIMLSDVDEVISAEAVRKILKNPPANNEVYCLELRYFHFFLNLEVPKIWLRTSPRVVRFASLRNMRGLRSLRPPHTNKVRNFIRGLKASVNMRRITKRTVIPNAGWHFSWLGGEESVAIKAQSISTHSNLSNDYATPFGAQRIIGRAIEDFSVREVDQSFPRGIFEHQEKYQHLILKKDGQ